MKYAHAIHSRFVDVSILLVKLSYYVPRGLQCPEAQPPGQLAEVVATRGYFHRVRSRIIWKYTDRIKAWEEVLRICS